jgi:hypothetical protein
VTDSPEETLAPAALAAVHGHTVIYIGNPATGVRGILAHVVTALGGKPVHGTAALAVQAWTILAGERHARLGTSGDRLRAPRRCQARRRGQAGVQAGAAQRRGQGIQAGPQRPGTRNQRGADERSRQPPEHYRGKMPGGTVIRLAWVAPVPLTVARATVC